MVAMKKTAPLTIPDWLKDEYPFTPANHTTASGARLSYLDEGEGNHAVLMLHGNPTWSFYYRNLVKEISPHRRCIVPDHIGMGLSDKPADYDYKLATRIADVVGLIDELELKRIDLVVHDWGGAIGFGVAEQRPDLIGCIVIMNTAAFTSMHIPRRIALCRLPLIGPLIVRGGNGFAGPAVWMAMRRKPLTKTQSRGYLLPYDSWANRVAVSGFVQDIPMNDMDPSWSALKKVEQGIPKFRNHATLVIWGGRDFCFNDHFHQEWLKRLPHADDLYLEDAGHYVLEDASNDVVPRIREHLLKN
jgi:haloalkane dehalogenase